MENRYDVVIIGTGTAGYTAAYELIQSGKKVAIVDKQAYGGTCAMRGCQPKKYFVAAAESLERVRHMARIGIEGNPQINWSELVASKSTFTDAVPERTENGFNKAGIITLHGEARFIDEKTIDVDGQKIEADKFIIATGAKPMQLGIEGEFHLLMSDDFMTMPEMPGRIIFVGGGFISFEFAHIARQAGAEVTILHRDDKPLNRFEPELVKALCQATSAAGIRVVTDYPVNGVVKSNKGFLVHGADCNETYEADAVFHGAGRMPDIETLNLDAVSVNTVRSGVIVDQSMKTSNSNIYAIGDAANSIQLATVADMEAIVAAHHILGKPSTASYEIVPSAVFTLPPLATVGMTEHMAADCETEFRVNSGEMSNWPSSKRIGQQFARYKVIIDVERDLIMGAHILGYNSSEMINILAMAMTFNITISQLKNMIWAYPTHTSDLKYMLG